MDAAELENIAASTADFSYAYLNEAYVSALMSLARQEANESLSFMNNLEERVQVLRASIAMHKVEAR